MNISFSTFTLSPCFPTPHCKDPWRISVRIITGIVYPPNGAKTLSKGFQISEIHTDDCHVETGICTMNPSEFLGMFPLIS